MLITRPARCRRLRLTRRGQTVVAVLALSLVTAVVLAATAHGTGRTTITAVAGTGPTGPGAPAAARPVPPSAGRSSPPAARTADGVPLAVASAVAAAGGQVGTAVYDAVDGRTWSYQDRPGWVEGSIAKLSILGAELRAEQAGALLTSAVAQEEAESIENSDNDAASALFDRVGSDGIEDFADAVGAHGVALDPAGHWGLAASSALDQVQVMRAYAYPSAALTDASRALAATLFAAVESDQRWGATGGVPAGVVVQVKDGWLPHGEGWVMNTVGHVAGEGRDYVVAIMSAGNASEQAGIDRLERVAAAVYVTAATAGSRRSGTSRTSR